MTKGWEERINFIVPGNDWACNHDEGREKVDFRYMHFINKAKVKTLF